MEPKSIAGIGSREKDDFMFRNSFVMWDIVWG